MIYFTKNNTINAIKRQTYTGGKSSYATTSSTTGYLRPLSEEQAAANQMQWGQAFSLIVETRVDIQETDRVIVDLVEYTVKGVVNHNRGGITAYKKALLALPQAA